MTQQSVMAYLEVISHITRLFSYQPVRQASASISARGGAARGLISTQKSTQ